MKKRLKFIDLFSGCGGFSKGFELAGHKCLLGVDFDKHAIETFKQNHQGSQSFCGDIRKLTKTKMSSLINIQEVDVVIGGPPCQGFSTVGKGDQDDKRNSLFKDFVRIVKLCNPKVVVFENVTGILAKKNQPTLNAIFKSFERLGYTMEARVLSAEEYGVPEKRRRTIIIGTKECNHPIFPQLTHGERGEHPYQTVKNAFANLKAPNKKIYNHDVATAQIKNDLDLKRLSHIPDGKGIRYQKDEMAYLPKRLRFDVDWKKIPENRFRQIKLQRLDSNKPSPTILTSRTTYFHPKENRHLTVREAAACQSFPNDFVFCGSLTAQFRQIGNAVPPLLAKAIGEAATEMVFGKKKTKKHSAKRKQFYKNAFNYDHQVTV